MPESFRGLDFPYGGQVGVAPASNLRSRPNPTIVEEAQRLRGENERLRTELEALRHQTGLWA